MAHFTGPDVSGRISPAIHAGINAHTSLYGIEAQTVTGSQSFSMMALPAGARIRGARLTSSTPPGLGELQVILTTGNTERAKIIQTASANVALSWGFDPNHVGNVYKTTASSNVVVVLEGTMSASVSTTFALTLLYTTDGDEGGSSSPGS